MKPLLLILALTSLPVLSAEPAPRPATPPPKKRILTCDPYAEKCPACKDCSRCRACSKEGNRCSVKRAQLGMR